MWATPSSTQRPLTKNPPKLQRLPHLPPLQLPKAAGPRRETHLAMLRQIYKSGTASALTSVRFRFKGNKLFKNYLPMFSGIFFIINLIKIYFFKLFPSLYFNIHRITFVTFMRNPLRNELTINCHYFNII